MQESIVRLLTFDLSNENKFLHLLFPSTISELNRLNHFLENSKQNKQNTSPLLKLTKKIFKSTNIENLSSTMTTFLQALVEHNEPEKVLFPFLQQHDEILRLVEQHRPNWIKFAVIFILLGIEIIKQQQNEQFIQLSVIMVFKLLKRLANEVNNHIQRSFTDRFLFRLLQLLMNQKIKLIFKIWLLHTSLKNTRLPRRVIHFSGNHSFNPFQRRTNVHHYPLRLSGPIFSPNVFNGYVSKGKHLG